MKIIPITINVDTRERTPLLFPSLFLWKRGRGFPETRIKVALNDARLPAGDYLLEIGPGNIESKPFCIVERKQGPLELFNNLCTEDFKRQSRAFKKLSRSCDYPILLIESSPVLFHRFCISRGFPHLIHYLYSEADRWGLEVLWGGYSKSPSSRRLLGELVLGRMLSRIFPSSSLTPRTPRV